CATSIASLTSLELQPAAKRTMRIMSRLNMVPSSKGILRKVYVEDHYESKDNFVRVFKLLHSSNGFQAVHDSGPKGPRHRFPIKQQPLFGRKFKAHQRDGKRP